MAGNSKDESREKQNLLGLSNHVSQPSGSETSKVNDIAVTLALSNSALRALSFLGSKRVVDSVLDILELEYSVSLNDVGRRPNAFLNGIESMFGPGSNVITKMLCAEIARDLGISREGKTLLQLVKLAHEKLDQTIVSDTDQGTVEGIENRSPSIGQ